MKNILCSFAILSALTMYGQQPSVTLSASPSSGAAPLTVTLQATCPTCVAYVWNFGDGTPPPIIKNMTQAHTFHDPGVYTVIFAGVDKNGAPQNTTVDVNVQGNEDNKYCSTGNVWTGDASDGPAALPNKCLNTSLANTPSSGTVVTVQPNQLQSAYNSAHCGDVLQLAHGQTWSGTPSFASKNCDDQHWITIRSDAIPSSPGARVPKGSETQMARLLMKQGITVWGDHIRFIGIEFAKQPGGIMFLMAQMHGANKIIFDRCSFHGNPKEESQHGITLNTGKNVAVIDSRLYEFHCIAKTGACVDSQAISGGTGAAGDDVTNSGPLKIVNNYIEASGENILFGGSHANGPGPNDVEIRRNWLNKPMSWNPLDPSYAGVPYIVKNDFELKNGTRILIEGNVFTNTWSGYTQPGAAILFTPKNQAGQINGKPANLCPNCAVLDTTFRYNSISTAAMFMVIGSGVNDNGAYCAGQHRTSIHDIIVDDLQYSTCYQCSSMLNELGSGYAATNPPPVDSILSSVSIQNLTIVNSGNRAGQPGATAVSALFNIGSIPPGAVVPQVTNVGFVNSIAPTMSNGFVATGGGTSNCMNVTTKPATPAKQWPGCFVGNSPFTGNVLVGWSGKPTDWPAGNSFEANFNNLFINFNGGKGGDYHLVANSPYAGHGADIDKVNQYTSGVKQ
jgi:hypothetical protein